ncbi:hypothetical protein LguiB_021695 [Lonicera macranthoides]
MAIVKAQAAASSSSSTSSSSSSPPPSISSFTSKSSYTYDVFLNFKGEDTRNSFADQLYNALLNKGFLTFRDKEGIHKGKSLKPEFDKAIKQSRYAWCLNELVMILDQKKTSGHDVLPVFYDVKPSEVQKQNGRTG